MMTAVKQGDGYVLPVLIGDVELPAELMHPHIHYLRAEDYTTAQLAVQMQQRVGVRSATQSPRDIGAVVQEAGSLRLPKITRAPSASTRSLASPSSTSPLVSMALLTGLTNLALLAPSSVLSDSSRSESSGVVKRRTCSTSTAAAASAMTS